MIRASFTGLWGSVLQRVAVCCSVLQCGALWGSVLQRVAVCCNVLQHVAACFSGEVLGGLIYLHDKGIIHRSVLQRVAACCSVFLCCSVLQCVAVCCGM